MPTTAETDFIGMLYDAAMDRLPWRDAVAAMTHVLDAETSNLLAHDPLDGQTTLFGMHNVSDEFMRIYEAEFVPHDLWIAGAVEKRLYDQPLLNTDLISPAAWERSVIYNEFLRQRSDAFHLVGAVLRLHGGHVLTIGCHRPRAGLPFQIDHRRRLARLLPHFRRSMELHQRIGNHARVVEAAGAAFDQLPPGLVQLGPARRVMCLNTAARRIIDAGDGLRIGGGILHALSADDDRRLQALVRQAVATTADAAAESVPDGYVRIRRPSGKRPFSVLVCPLGSNPIAPLKSSPCVLVFLGDPEEQPRIQPSALRELYGLTPAEGRVTVGLASGYALNEIAGRLDISINTARTLLARAMAKTRVTSQAALVRLTLLIPTRS